VPELSGSTDLVLGIKEAPITEVEKLLAKNPGKKRTWMMFSHTHKGQVSRVPLILVSRDQT
jgi:alpha-aminoadipic semialdehyde synthase